MVPFESVINPRRVGTAEMFYTLHIVEYRTSEFQPPDKGLNMMRSIIMQNKRTGVGG